jgi:hypothetical protein
MREPFFNSMTVMKKLSGVWWTPFEVSRASMNGDNGWYYKHEVTHDMKSLQFF